MLFDEGDNYYYSNSQMFSYITSSQNYSNSSKKSKMMINKKRFSDEQVKSLETIFENETKLEPKKKVELAKELGLQPRQISIWFQNKRARYKSKQLECDFNVLTSNYNSLLSKFHLLKKEKQSLSIELEKLKEQAVKTNGEKQCGNESSVTNREESLSQIDKVNNNNNNDNNNNDNDEESNNQNEEKQRLLSKEKFENNGANIILSSDEGSSESRNDFGINEETNLLSTIVQPSNVVSNASLLTSSQVWGDLHHECLFDQHVDDCHWLDFWH